MNVSTSELSMYTDDNSSRTARLSLPEYTVSMQSMLCAYELNDVRATLCGTFTTSEEVFTLHRLSLMYTAGEGDSDTVYMQVETAGASVVT